MDNPENIQKKKYIYSKEKVKEYNQTYKIKHKDELLTCEICFGNYSVLNKAYHPHSKRHQVAIAILKSLSTPRVNHEKAESD